MTPSFGARHILRLALWHYSAQALTWRFDVYSASTASNPLVLPKSNAQQATAALRACMRTCVLMGPQCGAVSYRSTDGSCASLPAGFLRPNTSDNTVLVKTESNSEYTVPAPVLTSTTTTLAPVSSDAINVTYQSKAPGIDVNITSPLFAFYSSAEAEYNATSHSTSVELATSSNIKVQEGSTSTLSIVTSTHEQSTVPALQSGTHVEATEYTKVNSQESAIDLTNGSLSFATQSTESSEAYVTSSFLVSSSSVANAVTTTTEAIATNTKFTVAPVTGGKNASDSTSKAWTPWSYVHDSVTSYVASNGNTPSKNSFASVPLVDCRSTRNVSNSTGKGVIELRKLTLPVRMKNVTANEFGVWTVGEDRLLYLLQSPTNSCSSANWTWQRIDGIKEIKNVTFWNESVYVYTTSGSLYACQSAAFSGSSCAANCTSMPISLPFDPVNLKMWSSYGFQGYYAAFDNKVGYKNGGVFTECPTYPGSRVKSLVFGEAGLWVVDSNGKVMQSSKTYPSNTGCSLSWNVLENSGFISAASAKDEVLLLASNGTCFIRCGVGSTSDLGATWLQASAVLSQASMSPSNVIWGVDFNGTLFSSLV